jgi:lipopolysaccharide export LptBFGC system permease protein LptF
LETCRCEAVRRWVPSLLKILMAVVIGALVLAGLYMLFDQTVLPTLVQRIKDMFNYAG